MKYLLNIAVALLLFSSCKKETTEIQDMSVNPDDITRIELRADHQTLLPNGKAQMQFYPIAYVKTTNVVYVYDKATLETKKDTVEIEYQVPNDLLPKESIKVYDEKGNLIKDNLFSTTSSAADSINFIAKFRNLESNLLPIKVRPLPSENYEEIVVPVIFHMVLPPATAGVSYDISSAYLQSVLDRVNDVFAARVTKDPNGGNAKIVFKLALYNPKGGKLAEAGKNILNLTATDMNTIGTSSLKSAYDKFIVANKSKFIYDPNKYLNVWLIRFGVSSSTAPYYAEAPAYMLSGYDLASIPGLKATTKDSYDLSDIVVGESCLQSGIMSNYMTFLNPQAQSVSNPFNFSKALGAYYGLFDPASASSTYPTTDPDYCDDTNTSYNMSSVFKDNSKFKALPAGVSLNYFTSFHVMDSYTRGNSITVDQAERIRKVILQCPNRQSHKSSFALTGKN